MQANNTWMPDKKQSKPQSGLTKDVVTQLGKRIQSLVGQDESLQPKQDKSILQKPVEVQLNLPQRLEELFGREEQTQTTNPANQQSSQKQESASATAGLLMGYIYPVIEALRKVVGQSQSTNQSQQRQANQNPNQNPLQQTPTQSQQRQQPNQSILPNQQNQQPITQNQDVLVRLEKILGGQERPVDREQKQEAIRKESEPSRTEHTERRETTTTRIEQTIQRGYDETLQRMESIIGGNETETPNQESSSRESVNNPFEETMDELRARMNGETVGSQRPTGDIDTALGRDRSRPIPSADYNESTPAWVPGLVDAMEAALPENNTERTINDPNRMALDEARLFNLLEAIAVCVCDCHCTGGGTPNQPPKEEKDKDETPKWMDEFDKFMGKASNVLSPVNQGMMSDRIEDNLGGVSKGLSEFGRVLAVANPVVGGAVFAVGKLGEAIFGTIGFIDDWDKHLHEADLRFAEFSASMSMVMAERNMRDIVLSQQRGENRAASARQREEASSRWDRAFAPINDAMAKAENKIVAWFKNLVAGSPGMNNLNAMLVELGLAGAPVNEANSMPAWAQNLANSSSWMQEFGRPNWIQNNANAANPVQQIQP